LFFDKVKLVAPKAHSLTLGILGTLAHFRHSKQGAFQDLKKQNISWGGNLTSILLSYHHA